MARSQTTITTSGPDEMGTITLSGPTCSVEGCEQKGHNAIIKLSEPVPGHPHREVRERTPYCDKHWRERMR